MDLSTAVLGRLEATWVSLYGTR